MAKVSGKGTETEMRPAAVRPSPAREEVEDLVNRLRGRYAFGPHLPNGEPEFGWKQFEATPINIEAADFIAREILGEKSNVAAEAEALVKRARAGWYGKHSSISEIEKAAIDFIARHHLGETP
jgi:hypothetical protein